MHQGFAELVTLPEPVPPRLAGELAKRIHFISENIDRFELVTGPETTDAEVIAVRLWLSEPVTALSEKLSQLVNTEVLPQRAVPAHEIWRSAHVPKTVDGVFDELVAAGAVQPTGEGQFAFGRPFTQLIEVLDGYIREIARKTFHPPEINCPSLIRTDTLARSGYLTSFPQLLMFAGRLHADLDDYDSFLKTVSEADKDGGALVAVTQALADHGTHSGYVLSPAVCYHVYAQHAGAPLPGTLTVVSARGSCYRHESRYHRSLERLWEFNMRETVLMGEADAVAQAREQLMHEVFALVEELGLAGHAEAASDPFFCSAEAARRTWAQRALQLKYELILPVSGGNSVAAVSFNTHGTTLGEAFSLTARGGGSAHTGCVAVGLERLAYAFLSRHGTNPDGWPQPVRIRYERLLSV